MKPQQIRLIGTGIEITKSMKNKMERNANKSGKGIALCLSILQLFSTLQANAQPNLKQPSVNLEFVKVEASTDPHAKSKKDDQKLLLKTNDEQNFSGSTDSSIPSINSVAGGDGSGGGDPLEISAANYPDTAGLDNAIALIQNRLQASRYSEEFKNKVTNEIQSLRNNEKYKMLPMMIILGPGMGPEGYAPPQDANRFTSLGGMTRFEGGATIFLSERVTHYSTSKLAELILHEAIHHVIPLEASRDEVFVEDLSRAILAGEYHKSYDLAVRTGIVIRQGYVSGRGLYAYSITKFVKNFYQRESESDQNAMVKIALKFVNQAPINVASGSGYERTQSYAYLFNKSEILNSIALEAWDLSLRNDFVLDIGALSQEFDPSNPIKNLWSCKGRTSGFFLFQKCEDPATIGDLLNFDRVER